MSKKNPAALKNAEALKNAFAAADNGDPVPLVELYDDSLTWAGFALDGTQRVYTKTEFLEAFGVLAKLDESRNEVVSVEVIDDELVTANVRAYRRLGDQELDVTIVMTHRFIDGKVTRGTDIVPSSFERFWADTGISL
ncbi:MAG: nuclear transport factor 2 family protein [Gordonia sp. (in: high G+C Gram-positive bacteria)]